MHSPLPLTKDLVLIGGGHTHALVLRMWGMNPLPGTRLTVITPEPTAAYSGMLPGFLAGHYSRDMLDIDLIQLARFAGARVVLGAATAIDPDTRQITVPGRAPIAYDVASVDIGINTQMPDLPGFSDHAVPAKPLGPFCDAWQDYLNQSGPASVAVIGGGIAGAEIALAFGHALKSRKRDATLHLIEKESAFRALQNQAAEKLRDTAHAAGITLLEHTAIDRIDPGAVITATGPIPATFICGAAGAQPHALPAQTGLDLQDGYFRITPDLRSSDPNIFAVGDCAHMGFAPRPKAGVYAVRQAPILLHNLRVALSQTGKMRAYQPQKDYLKLISLGRKSALADKFGRVWSGPLMWRWKNRIDQKFMRKFKPLPDMPAVKIPARAAADLHTLVGGTPLCGGCGSKLGQVALQTGIHTATGAPRPDVTALPGDDAALLQIRDQQVVMTTDHLRAMVDDPVIMTRIAATHALGDIWAMGAQPQAATATLILPRQSETLATRQMREIMTTAHDVMTQAGAAIVGGHSSLGAELTIGFTLTGICTRAPITLAGAQPGDRLILTKPLGSGILMAAEMQKRARGADVHTALRFMSQSQDKASQILHTAHAMTDVTGFGLVGHLRNICQASHVGARLTLDQIPPLPGAVSLAQVGIRSTLHPANQAGFPDIPDTPAHALLFDPQTAGGLLAAVPAPADDTLIALKDAGYTAAIVGEITDQPGQIDIL